MPTIEIYGRGDCSFCEKAKRFCVENSLPHAYHDVALKHLRDQLMSRLPAPPKTVPVIFVGRMEITGGFTGLVRAHETGALQQVIGGE